MLQSCVKPRQLNAEGQKISRSFPVLMNLQTLPSFSAVLCPVIFARTLKKGMFPLVGEDLAFETKPHVHCLSMKCIVWELACALQEHCSVSPTTGCFRLRSNFICVGRGGENDAATRMTTVLWNIKGSHMLILNSPIFSSRLRKVKYLCLEWFIRVELSACGDPRAHQGAPCLWVLSWFCHTLLPQIVTPGVDLVQVLISNLWRKTSMGSQSISPVSKRKAWDWLQVLFYVTVSLEKAMDLWFWTFEYVMPCQLTRLIFSPTKNLSSALKQTGKNWDISWFLFHPSRPKRLHSIYCPRHLLWAVPCICRSKSSKKCQTLQGEIFKREFWSGNSSS